ncbi:MAG: hypothetical protein AAGG68_14950 [Bacteroidota bacterium]
MNRIRKLLTQHWVVNLITTTVGVYLGIFATNYYAKKSAIEKTEKAFEKVRTELVENFEAYLEWDSMSRINYEALEFIVDNKKEDGTFIMTSTQMDSVKRKYTDFLTIEDSILVELDTFQYEGSFELGLESSLLIKPSSNTAWIALKSSEYFSYLQFDCIKGIEGYYDLAQLSFVQRKKWFDMLFFDLMVKMLIDTEEEPDELFMKKLLAQWKIENALNEGIVESIPELKESLKDCIEH